MSRTADPNTTPPAAESSTPHSAIRIPHSPHGPPWLGPILHRTQIDIKWLLVAATLLLSGMFFFGWRGMLTASVAAMTTLVSFVLVGLVRQLLRPRSPQDSSLHALTLGLLLGAALPVVHDLTVPLLAGLILGIAAHTVGRSQLIRIHPVALTLVLVWLLPTMLVRTDLAYSTRWMFESNHGVLRPGRVILGDTDELPGAGAAGAGFPGQSLPGVPTPDAWWHVGAENQADAIRRYDPYARLLRDQHAVLQHRPHLVNLLTSGELPRLGEVILGSVPGPLGATSRILVIVLGLYLMWLRFSRYPMTLAALGAAAVTLLVMPVPFQGETSVVLVRLVDLGPAVSVTYLAYAILASPLLFVTLILAPMTAPMSRQGRLIYGAVLGSLVILLPWFLHAPPAAYVGLLLASVLSRPLDALQRGPLAHPN